MKGRHGIFLLLLIVLAWAPDAFARAGGGSAGFGGGGRGGYSGGGGYAGGGEGTGELPEWGWALIVISALLFLFMLICSILALAYAFRAEGFGWLAALAASIGLHILGGIFLALLDAAFSAIDALFSDESPLLALMYVLGGIGCIIVVLWVVIELCTLVARAVQRLRSDNTESREEQVRLAALEAAEDNPAFVAGMVEADAEQLFRAAQAAWDARDRNRLRELVGAELLVEWERRLDDFERRGWHNRVEVLGEVQVDYVGLNNSTEEREDRAVVRIVASLRDYVSDDTGRTLSRVGEWNEKGTMCEYWTLGRRDGRWILLSIEQQGEGDHHLEGRIVASPWSDTERLRDESLLEAAVADKVGDGFPIAEVADLDFDRDAHAAALDLSLVDGRFAPAVLELTARRAVRAWAEAVDGDRRPLEAIATEEAVDHLLHRPAPDRSARLVVRGPEVKHVQIAALDAHAEPPTITIEAEVAGRCYVEHRDTAEVLAGSRTAAVTFTERWLLALSSCDQHPWQIVADATAQPTPHRQAAR
jgi:predicted lipid-binding transport protein (Tim44 family)